MGLLEGVINDLLQEKPLEERGIMDWLKIISVFANVIFCRTGC